MSTTQPDSSTTDAAKGEAKHVADVASSEAQNVAQEAKAHAKGLLDDARSQVDEQSRTQLSNLTDLIGKLGDDLGQMAEASEQNGLAKDVTRAAADRAHEVRSRIAGRDPSDLLEEVREFARRRPGTFLIGALAAGVVAGRFVRGTKDSNGNSHRAGDQTTGPTSGLNGDPGGPSLTAPIYDPIDDHLGAAPSAGTSTGTGSVDAGPLSATELAGARHGDDPARPWGTTDANPSPSQGGPL